MLRKLIHKCALGLYVVSSLLILVFFSVAAAKTQHPFFFIAIAIEFLGVITCTCELYLLGRTRPGSTSSVDVPSSQVYVFIEDEDLDTARISLLSSKYLHGSPQITVICREERYDIESLCNEFGFTYLTNEFSVDASTEDVLFTNGHTILYPDALLVAQRRRSNSVSYIELNHSSYSSHALGNGNVAADVSRASLIATSASSYSILVYAGGPVLAKTHDLIEAGNCTASVFADVIAFLSSSSFKGAITSHPCCECISHNEIDHNISSRIEKLKVSRRMHAFPRKSNLSMRAHIAHFYSRIYWARSIQLILIGALVIGVVLGSVPAEYFLVLGGLILIAQSASYVCSHLRGDHRRPFERLRDSVLDCEAFIHVIALRLRSRSSFQRYRIRFVPMYLCVLLAAIVARFISAPQALTFGSSSFNHHALALGVGGIAVVVLYRAMYRYLSARQRAFARRNVSITGSSSYESMWIVDLTHRGAAYISDSQLDIGDDTPLVFRVPTMTGDSLITVVGKVTYCGARGDKYQVGVAFKELSQSAQDDLAVYCSIIYPYHIARGIDDAENVSKEIPINSASSHGIRRDRLSFVTYSFVAAAVAGIVLACLPITSDSHEKVVQTAGRVSSLVSSKYSIDTLVEKSHSALSGTSNGGVSSVGGQYDLSVSQEILNVASTGFKSGDVVTVRITVRNVGPGPVQPGFVVTETLGKDFDEKSAVMTNTSGFMPCGFASNEMECVSPSGLAAGESRSIEFSVASHVVASSESSRRLLTARVKPSSVDGEEITSPFVSVSNNVDKTVLPVGNSTSLGDRVYFDANANGTPDPGEPGVAGVHVDLVQFQNINGDTEMDPGETPAIAHDVTDANGYYGVSKGTSSFQHLSPGYQYAVQFAHLPEGLDATLTSRWVLLGEGVVDTSLDVGLISQQHDLVSKIFVDTNRNGRLDKKEKGIDVGIVGLVKWVDVNSNKKQDKGEVLDAASQAASTDGDIAFSAVDDIYPTYYAAKFTLPGGYDVQHKDATVNKSLVISAFVPAKAFHTSPIALIEKGTTVDGAVYLDFNENAQYDDKEYGHAGVKVHLVSVDKKTTLTTTTQRDGRYEFTDVVNGQYYLGIDKATMPNDFIVAAFDSESLSGSLSGRKDISFPVALNESVTLLDLPIIYHGEQTTIETQPPSQVHHIIHGNFADVSMTREGSHRIRIVVLGVVVMLGALFVGIVAVRRKLVFRNK